jgi:hypothetical protein
MQLCLFQFSTRHFIYKSILSYSDSTFPFPPNISLQQQVHKMLFKYNNKLQGKGSHRDDESMTKARFSNIWTFCSSAATTTPLFDTVLTLRHRRRPFDYFSDKNPSISHYMDDFNFVRAVSLCLN